MSFVSIATPFVELGIPVFPLMPKTKIPPAGFRFLEEATMDPGKVASWNDENPDYNVALLANGEFCFLEFDVAKGMSAAAAEMEHEIPLTRTQVSGKGFSHHIFRHTERSRALGNRSVNLPEGGEWFSFRAGNKYLVGAGSLHPNGNYYQNARDPLKSLKSRELADWRYKSSTFFGSRFQTQNSLWPTIPRMAVLCPEFSAAEVLCSKERDLGYPAPGDANISFLK
jgi:hypothetical protein